MCGLKMKQTVSQITGRSRCYVCSKRGDTNIKKLMMPHNFISRFFSTFIVSYVCLLARFYATPRMIFCIMLSYLLGHALFKPFIRIMR